MLDPAAITAVRPDMGANAMIIVIMGVAGSGKTTIGRRLAADLGWGFHDADDFHPPANIAKMAAGTPLTDADRLPWLDAIRSAIDRWAAEGTSAVVACSALRKSYRTILTADRPEVRLVHLAGDYALILRRLQERAGHFMKPAMLASQFATLEAPQDAITLNIDQEPAAIVAQIRRSLSL